MAGYIEAITTWKADEEELNQKRNSISTRLEQVRQQAHEDMAKARQAETDAATAYAQAVAWGDEKVRKKLMTMLKKPRNISPQSLSIIVGNS